MDLTSAVRVAPCASGPAPSSSEPNDMKQSAAKKAFNPLQALLQRQQASHTVLAFKTRAAHWQLTGRHFNHLHELLGKHYDQLDEMIDELAERNRMLRSPALVGLAAVLKESDVADARVAMDTADGALTVLLADHETLIRQLRKDAETAARHEDPGTNDFLIGLLRVHEKMAWFYRASLGQN